MKFYKTLLRAIQIAVICVVLPRVASFVGKLGPGVPGFDVHDIISVAFAVTLGIGTVATAYFSNETRAPEYDDEPSSPRERRRREKEVVYYTAMFKVAPYARTAMWIFAFLDSMFNLAEAFFGAYANGLFDVAKYGQFTVGIYVFATFVYGISPTLLAIFLSRVIAMVDRVPEGYEKPKRGIDVTRTVMGNLGLREYKYTEAESIEPRTNTERTQTHRTPNVAVPTNGRTPTDGRENLINAGSTEVRDRIVEYIQATWANETRVPGPTETSEALGVSKSYASTVITEWRNQFDPFHR